MIEFTMRAASDTDREVYGLLFESVELVDVKGSGVHNRHHPHGVQIWRDAACTGGVGTHILNARDVVIANTPVNRPPHLGTVHIGDTVALVMPDGTRSLWTVDRRWLHDPVLVPVPPRQFCRVNAHDCLPAVTLTFDGGVRALHWCTEHAADAERYRNDDNCDQRN